MSASDESYGVRREAYASIREELHEFLARVPNHEISPARCEWLYERNPGGPAALWTLRRGEELLGYTVAVPRPMMVLGEPVRGWIGADFLIDPRCRTLGPALKLRRAARDAIDAGEADLLYSFPNVRMSAIHHRVGHVALGTMQRMVLPLRAGAQVRQRLGDSRWADLAARLVDVALRLRLRLTRCPSGTRLHGSVDSNFDAQFDDLFTRAAPHHSVIGWRGAAYLQWRFAENPHYRSRVLFAFVEDRLAGYAVISHEGDTVHIRDILVEAQPGIACGVIGAVAREALGAGANSVTLNLLNASRPYVGEGRSGFVAREGSDAIFVYTRANGMMSRAQERHRWHLTIGDRDI